MGKHSLKPYRSFPLLKHHSDDSVRRFITAYYDETRKRNVKYGLTNNVYFDHWTHMMTKLMDDTPYKTYRKRYTIMERYDDSEATNISRNPAGFYQDMRKDDRNYFILTVHPSHVEEAKEFTLWLHKSFGAKARTILLPNYQEIMVCLRYRYNFYPNQGRYLFTVAEPKPLNYIDERMYHSDDSDYSRVTDESSIGDNPW